MNRLQEVLEYNKKFVEQKGYEKYITSKHPDKKMVILIQDLVRIIIIIIADKNVEIYLKDSIKGTWKWRIQCRTNKQYVGLLEIYICRIIRNIYLNRLYIRETYNLFRFSY